MVLRNVFSFWMRYRARGFENLPEKGALFLINHQSFLDPLMVGLPLARPVSFLARDSLFRVPVIGWILRRTYVMPIRREAATTDALKESIRRIEHGFYVGIFPEGTRSASGQIGPIKPGFIAMLRRAHCPVVIIAIAGSAEAMPRHTLMLFPRRVHVVFGDPIAPETLAPLLERGREQELLAFVRDEMVRLHALANAWRTSAPTR